MLRPDVTAHLRTPPTDKRLRAFSFIAWPRLHGRGAPSPCGRAGREVLEVNGPRLYVTTPRLPRRDWPYSSSCFWTARKAQFNLAVRQRRVSANRGAIPPMIVVGVTTGATERRDLTPPPQPGREKLSTRRAGRFADFLLVSGPFVDRSYDAAASYWLGFFRVLLRSRLHRSDRAVRWSDRESPSSWGGIESDRVCRCDRCNDKDSAIFSPAVARATSIGHSRFSALDSLQPSHTASSPRYPTTRQLIPRLRACDGADHYGRFSSEVSHLDARTRTTRRRITA